MRRGTLLALAPLMIAPVAVYNLFALTLPGALRSKEAYAHLTGPLLQLTTAGGGAWPITPGDLFLTGALVALFVELVKSTSTRRITMINHGLSILLFAICLGEMLLVPACATSTFLLITLMVLLDVLVGFMVRQSGRAPPLSDVR